MYLAWLREVENISYVSRGHSWICNMSSLYRESKTCEDQEKDIDDLIIALLIMMLHLFIYSFITSLIVIYLFTSKIWTYSTFQTRINKVQPRNYFKNIFITNHLPVCIT